MKERVVFTKNVIILDTVVKLIISALLQLIRKVVFGGFYETLYPINFIQVIPSDGGLTHFPA
ncbi:hypothetical protein TI05_18270 [Achromatium sp. WMS3]|nr:hypothetical protein TI05_18270 [Achromatium sp. WMS3]